MQIVRWYLASKVDPFLQRKFLKIVPWVAVVYPCLALRSPYSGCFVDAGNVICGDGEEAPRFDKPFSQIAERRIFTTLYLYSPLNEHRDDCSFLINSGSFTGRTPVKVALLAVASTET